MKKGTNFYVLLHVLRIEECMMMSLSDFYIKLCDIPNESFALGEKIPETTLARKIMRSLPERFSSKVIVIEEAKDLDSMKVKEKETRF